MPQSGRNFARVFRSGSTRAVKSALPPVSRYPTWIAEKLLHPGVRIFAKMNEDGSGAVPIRLHSHQVEGIRARSYILTTGTGSGKSLSYIVPYRRSRPPKRQRPGHSRPSSFIR